VLAGKLLTEQLLAHDVDEGPAPLALNDVRSELTEIILREVTLTKNRDVIGRGITVQRAVR
jgi:hypothetical protein